MPKMTYVESVNYQQLTKLKHYIKELGVNACLIPCLKHRLAQVISPDGTSWPDILPLDQPRFRLYDVSCPLDETYEIVKTPDVSISKPFSSTSPLKFSKINVRGF